MSLFDCLLSSAYFSSGRAAGLRYVCALYLSEAVGGLECAYCDACDELLVERFGYRILKMRVGADGLCPNCEATIPGVWW